MAKVNVDPRPKTHFVLIDCVGVVEQRKTDTRTLNRKASVAFKDVIDIVGKGASDADTMSTQAGRARPGRPRSRTVLGEVATEPSQG
jgi:type I restriction enzyme R subunit